jgi:hypothetical protein
MPPAVTLSRRSAGPAAAPAGGVSVKTQVPSGRVVAVASDFGGRARRASRRASSQGDSKGTAETVAPATGLSSAKMRPRNSPAAALPARPRQRRSPAEVNFACFIAHLRSNGPPLTPRMTRFPVGFQADRTGPYRIWTF